MGERHGRRESTVRGAASSHFMVSDGWRDLEGRDSPLRVDAAAEATLAASARGRVATPEAALDIPGLLALLPAFDDEITAADRRLRECVQLLREHRATWREIGDALQVSRQAAWERFRTR